MRRLRRPAPAGVLREATQAVVLAFARDVEKRRPADYQLPLRVFGKKGAYGCLIELVFGLSCDNKPEPDFRHAKIELKSTKLKRLARGWVVGERTSLHQINYVTLPLESWDKATIKSKLGRILFCFYEWVPTKETASWVVNKMFFWQPDAQQWRYIQTDWEKIRSRCEASRADSLSEGDTLVLGAATKSANSRVLRPQFGGGWAKPRAFTLKQPFVRSIYEAACGRPATASVVKSLGIRALSAFETTLEARLHESEGQTIAHLAAMHGVHASSAKQFSAMVLGQVVRRLIGIDDSRAKIREFEEFGIEMHVLPIKANGSAKEALSFPAFRYRALLEEEWDTADLRLRLNRLLIIPVHAPRNGAPLHQWRLGHAFFWSPTEVENRVIHREWEMFRREIAAGRANRLTSASQTKIIHVRPKARNALDTDDAPVVGPVVKKAFWLNAHFLSQLVSVFGRSGAK